MATFSERAAHMLPCVLIVLCLYVILVISHYGFDGRTLVLMASVPGHCLPFTLCHELAILRYLCNV